MTSVRITYSISHCENAKIADRSIVSIIVLVRINCEEEERAFAQYSCARELQSSEAERNGLPDARLVPGGNSYFFASLRLRYLLSPLFRG